MTDIDVEYSNVYSNGRATFSQQQLERSRPRSLMYMYKLNEQQNFACRLKQYNGNSVCITLSPSDTLSDLYEKTENAIHNGVAYDLTPLRIYPKGAHGNVAISLINRPTLGDLSVEWCKKEYNIENDCTWENKKIKDLFVLSNENVIRSIPNLSHIRLNDFIKSNPSCFIPDPNSSFLKTYVIYVVDEKALEDMLKIKSESYWDTLKKMFSKSFSCKI